MKSSKIFKTVFFDTLKRFIPISIAYWGVLFFFYPAIMMLVRLSEMIDSLTADRQPELFDIYTTYGSMSQLGVTLTCAFFGLVFSAIISFIAFSYLHSKRQMDFVAALPVTRRVQFLGRLVAVMILSVLPVIVVTFIGTSVAGFENMGRTLELMLRVCVVILGNVSLVGLVSICSGTVAHTIVSYLLINVIYPVVMLFIGIYPQAVLPGIDEFLINANSVTLVSPITAIFTGTFSSVNDMEATFGFGFNGHTVFFYIWWVLFTAGLVLLSAFLIKKRKTESAQNSFAYVIPNVVIRFLVSLMAGLLGGIVLGLIFSNIGAYSLAVRNTEYIIVFLIGFIVFSFLSHLILHLIYHGGMKKFGKWLILFGAEVAVGLVFFFGISTDVMGYVTYVPDVSEIESVEFSDSYESFYVDGDNLKSIKCTDEKDIEKYVEFNKAISTEIKKAKGNLFLPVNTESYIPDAEETEAGSVYKDYSKNEYEDEDEDFNAFTITYNLKNGEKVTRSYDEDDTSITKEENELVNQFVKGIKEKDLDVIPEEYLDDVTIVLNMDSIGYDNHTVYLDSSRNIESLLSAVKKDIKEVGIIDNFAEGDFCMITFSFGNSENYTWEKVRFDSRYKNTVKCLKKLLDENKPLVENYAFENYYD